MFHKYLKWKKKYLVLKQQIGGDYKFDKPWKHFNFKIRVTYEYDTKDTEELINVFNMKGVPKQYTTIMESNPPQIDLHFYDIDNANKIKDKLIKKKFIVGRVVKNI